MERHLCITPSENIHKIYLYPHSEINYFVEEEVKGRKWCPDPADPDRRETSRAVNYHAALFSNATQARIIGRKGADLLFWHPAHDRIAILLADVRFIFTSRNLVNRTWSHCWFECAKALKTLSFEEALAA